MTAPARTRRTLSHRLTGLVALLLFAIFSGSIILAKAAMMGGFTAPGSRPRPNSCCCSPARSWRSSS